MDNINYTNENIESPQGPLPPSGKEKKTFLSKKQLLIGLGVFLGITILIVLVYFRLSFKKTPQVVNEANPIATDTPTQEDKRQPLSLYKLEEIFEPSEKISSNQTAPNNIYAFAVTQKSTPVGNTFKENENGPIVLVMDNLIFVNLTTKEKRGFDLYELASKEIIDPLKTIPVQTQYTLYVNLLKWTPNSENFWGAINLVSSADPPVNDSVSLFRINTKDWTIEKFALPGNFVNSLAQQNLNLERNAVLYESATSKNELYLYLYEILTKEKTIIVSYPNSVFSKYLPGKYGFLGYFYPSFSGVEPRQLEAKWLDKDTIFYIDFVTRKEVTKKIE